MALFSSSRVGRVSAVNPETLMTQLRSAGMKGLERRRTRKLPRRGEEERRLPEIRRRESDAAATVDARVEPRAGANGRRGVLQRPRDAVALRGGE